MRSAEQKVVLDPDPARGHALARQPVPLLLTPANYVANLRSLGSTDADPLPGLTVLAERLLS